MPAQGEKKPVLSEDFKAGGLEATTEYLIYASRWLLVPIFAGLIFLLLVLMVKFFQEMVYLSVNSWFMDKVDVILKALTLVDMALVASLLLMVAVSGYENLISKVEMEQGLKNKPSFFAKLDPGTIKIKLAMSIVAISSIHLLQVFLSMEKYTYDQVVLLMWIHMVFVASAVATALIDGMSKKKKAEAKAAKYGKGDDYGKDYGKSDEAH